VTIYIVDDNHDLVEFLACLLEDTGYKVHPFIHPEDALAHMKAHNIQPLTLITDYNLPLMNGYQLYKATQSHAPKVKTIVISGRDVSTVIGGLSFLQKPFTPEQLIQMINRL